MNAFFEHVEQAKQLLFVVLLGIIICYACYFGKFDFLTGMATGLFSALGVTQGVIKNMKGEKNEENNPSAPPTIGS